MAASDVKLGGDPFAEIRDPPKTPTQAFSE
jgi:hypothetical protein